MSGTYVFIALNGTIKSVTIGNIFAVEPRVIRLFGALPFKINGCPTFSIVTGNSVLVNDILCTGFINEAV